MTTSTHTKGKRMEMFLLETNLFPPTRSEAILPLLLQVLLTKSYRNII
jgi:hypothetical protein